MSRKATNGLICKPHERGVLGSQSVAKVVQAHCQFAHKRISGQTQVDFQLMDSFNSGLADVDCHTVVIGVHGVFVGLQMPTVRMLQSYIYEFLHIHCIYLHILAYTYSYIPFAARQSP